MTLRETLEHLLSTRGVRRAAVASGEGFIVESVGEDDDDRDFVAGLIASGLASSRALADLFGDDDLVQATIEYERGPVLLTPLSGEAADHVVVVVLDEIGSLGRVRLALRRMMGDIAAAVTA